MGLGDDEVTVNKAGHPKGWASSGAAPDLPREGAASQQQGVREMVASQGVCPQGVEHQPLVSSTNTLKASPGGLVSSSGKWE